MGGWLVLRSEQVSGVPLGVGLPAGPRLRPADLNRVLQGVADKPVTRLVNETVLRSQSQAVYSPDNLGHFGLALPRGGSITQTLAVRRITDQHPIIHARAKVTDFLTTKLNVAGNTSLVCTLFR